MLIISTHLHSFQEAKARHLYSIVKEYNFNCSLNENKQGFWELVFEKELTSFSSILKLGEIIGENQ